MHQIEALEHLLIMRAVQKTQVHPENRRAAFAFLDRVFGLPARDTLDTIEVLPAAALRATASGQVRAILADAVQRGYSAGISIEPHMVVVFHDAHSKANDDAMRANFVEYGRRLKKLIKGL